MMSGKPVVFVSSTIHDFRDLRTAIRYYLEELGYEVLLSEYNDFPKPLDENAYEACLATIERADYYILLIGSRVGALYDAANKISITRMEYRKAYKLASSGKLRIIAFLRDELWKVKTDREALLKFLESENGRWDLSEGDRQRIADHPSPLLDDAKTIFGFIDEVSRNSEMKAAIEGQAPFPGANWIHSFATFRDIASALRTSLGIEDSIARVALKANLQRELLENLVLLTEKGNDHIRPAYVWASFARKHLTGSVDDRSQMSSKYLRWVVLYSLSASRGRYLVSQFVEQALAAGEFLEYSKGKASYESTPLVEALFQLRKSIGRLRYMSRDSEESIIAFAAKYMDVAKTSEDVCIPNKDLLIPLAIADEEQNVVMLSVAILKALDGDNAALHTIKLNPTSPLDTEAERMKGGTVAIEDVRAWIAGWTSEN